MWLKVEVLVDCINAGWVRVFIAIRVTVRVGKRLRLQLGRKNWVIILGFG